MANATVQGGPKPGPFMTPTEAAAWLGVDRQTVYRMLRRGDIRGVKVGSAWRIGRGYLEAEFYAGGGGR